MHYLAKIKGVKDTEDGTDIIIRLPEKNLGDDLIRKRITKAEVRFDDGRTISNEQRKKIYASIRDIANWNGEVPEYMKEYLKYDYCIRSGEEYFSLSTCSMDLARDFITHIIDFVLEHNIPLSDIAINRTEDIDKYLYSCLKYRRCCITGKPNAEVHHVTGSRVGMGRSRVKISHLGLELIALSSEWHKKVHIEGEVDIFNAYKIYGIKLDKQTLIDLGMKAEDIT